MSMHDTLRGGSRLRLEKMRRYTKTWNEGKLKNPARRELTGFRDARSHGVGKIQTDAHSVHYGDGRAYMPASMLGGLRDVGNSHEIISRLPLGYYVDEYQDETISGHVWQLPARNGEPVFIAGYAERESEYAVLSATGSRLDTWDNKEDAARCADSIAERDAEKQREDNIKANEAQRLDDKCADLRETVNTCRSITAGRIIVLRALACGTDAYNIAAGMVADAREDFNAALAELVETRATLRTEYKDYL